MAAAVLVAVCCLVLAPSAAFAASKGTNGWYWPTGAEPEASYLGFLGWNSGWKGGAWHLGQDFGTKLDAPVYAIADGDVIYARMDVSGFGVNAKGEISNGGAVVVRHTTADGVTFYAVYGHLRNLDAQMQQTKTVKAGDRIGDVGPWINDWFHLHFGINGNAQLPANPYQGYIAGSRNAPPASPGGTLGWVDPIAFLKANKAPGLVQQVTEDVQGQVEDAAQDAANAAAEEAAQEAERQARGMCGGSAALVALGLCAPGLVAMRSARRRSHPRERGRGLGCDHGRAPGGGHSGDHRA